MSADLQHWSTWIGRAESAEDVIDPLRARAMQATLDRPEPALASGDALPPLWHWLYFWTVVPGSGLGPDGHPARGGFLPPIDLPQRMWAGSRVTFARPLLIGTTAQRTSTIADVQQKTGRSGALAFVTVRHEVADARGAGILEEQDIVYREAGPDGGPPAGEPAPEEASWRREISPDPVLLFRYSALTFNGHRIHYDHPFATAEGYPDLVVHGPLLATLMVDLVAGARPEATVRHFEFRALRPIFGDAPFTVAARPVGGNNTGIEVWVADPHGMLAMRGRIELAMPRGAGR